MSISIQKCLLLPAIILLWLSLTAIATAGGDNPVDRIKLPAELRTVVSHDESYQLTLKRSERTTVATLKHQPDKTKKVVTLWQHQLPHEYGPRLALVSSKGEVVFLDEWINVRSRHAVMVYHANGQNISHHSFDDVASEIRLKAREIVRKASTGWWIAGTPQFSKDSSQVLVPVADTCLSINLSKGLLSKAKCP